MALASGVLHLVERGRPTVLDAVEWQQIGLEDVLQQLRDAGVIGLEHVGAFRVVEPRQYVGSVTVGSKRFAVAPRVPRLFTALHNLVLSLPFRKSVSVAAGEMVLRDAPAVAFGEALEAMCLVGIPAVYASEILATAQPRSKLLVRETMAKLASRGVAHRVVTAPRVRRADAELNRVVFETATILRGAGLVHGALGNRLDLLLGLLDAPVMGSVRAIWEPLQDLERRYSEWPEVAQLLSICRTVHEGEEVLWKTPGVEPSIDGRFCNMDSLWERAIWAGLALAASEVSGSVLWHPYSDTSVPLLRDGGPAIDPDVVITKAGDVVGVVDAKYSDRDRAVAGDVYQIVCYADRVGGVPGYLVYYSSVPWFETLGETEQGSRIAAMGVTAESMRTDLESVVQQLMGTHH